MDIIGWIIVAHGVFWIFAAFTLIYPPAFLVYFLFSYMAGVSMPVAITLNAFIGLIQVALGLSLVFKRWRPILAWSSGTVFLVISIVLVILLLYRG
jgi:hypothetical protein